MIRDIRYVGLKVVSIDSVSLVKRHYSFYKYLGESMKKILVTGLVLSGILLSGCSTIQDAYYKIESTVADNAFESIIAESQEYVLEARLLISEGNIEEAKSYLDNAYELYPRQASLHRTYQAYYELTGNEKLSQLAAARYNAMVVKSDALNKKGHYAMTKMESLVLAEKLFSLSLVYHDENTATLMNIATLGYTTGDFELAQSSLKLLERLGHVSPESQFLNYMLAKRANDRDGMQIARFILQLSWPESRQYEFIKENEGTNWSTLS